jgi:peptidoglycan-N-acetylglucosamine deacetylase
MLDRRGVKATFFVLGSVAKEHPDIIRIIYKAGHEVASHAYSHTPLWDLQPDQFYNEIKLTNTILQDITGEKVLGFRAPFASLDNSTKWAIPILLEEGFRYDSSIFPMKTPVYGVNGAPLEAYYISEKDVRQADPEKRLLEVPFTILKTPLTNIPCGGGIYGRILPEEVLKRMWMKIAEKRTLNIYFHPWETDGFFPGVKAPLYKKVLAGFNTKGYLKKMECLSNSFRFTSFRNYLFRP